MCNSLSHIKQYNGGKGAVGTRGTGNLAHTYVLNPNIDNLSPESLTPPLSHVVFQLPRISCEYDGTMALL